MVFSRRATVYLWRLHFLFSDVRKRTSNPAPRSAGVLLFPSPSLIAPVAPPQEVINSSHYSFDKNTHFQRQTDLCTETLSCVPSPLWSWTAHFQTLITSRLQSKQRIAKTRRTHYWPGVFQAFPIISSLPPRSWLHLALKHSAATRLYFRLQCKLIHVGIAD